MACIRIVSCMVLATAALSLAACEDPAPSQAPASKGPQASSLPAGLILTAAPAESKGVAAAKSGAKVGDAVVLRGKIGGSKEPFVSGRAVFTIMDLELPSCADNPDDKCPTPWDYCCETSATIAANAATIQVVDQAGAVVKADMKGAPGLKPLSEVIVVGTVAQTDQNGTLVINASGIYPVGQ